MGSDCWGPDPRYEPPYPLGKAGRDLDLQGVRSNKDWPPDEWGSGAPAPNGKSDEPVKMVVERDGITVHYGEKGFTVEAVTEEARVILVKILPDLLKLFLEKNKKYASVQTGRDLGARGIVPDVNRKTGILVDRLWYGNPTIGEETDEVIQDLIGHLLLMLVKMRADE